MRIRLIEYLPKPVRRFVRDWVDQYINSYRVKGKTKIFCIGMNKTGTTSLKHAFIDLGFIIGNQKAAERLLPFYRNGDFQKIVNYCHTGQVFQDIPFSYPETFKHLDQAFPGCKFILTVRDSPEQWYQSVIKFESKMFGKNGELPTKSDLKNAKYIWKGWVWECYKAVWPTPEDDIYNQEILMNHYNAYNQSVVDYFKERPNQLIVINIAAKESYKRLMAFLDIKSRYTDFPWENKTSDIAPKKR